MAQLTSSRRLGPGDAVISGSYRPALRRAARERGGPLPSMAVADALPDERRELTGLPA